MKGSHAVCTLCLVLAGAPGAAAQTPRDRPPVGRPLSETHAAEAALTDWIAASPRDLQPRIELSRLQEETGRIADAETTLLEAQRVVGPSVGLLEAIAMLHNRQGDFEKTIHYLEEAAAVDPGDPRWHHLIAAQYQEKAARDYRLPAGQTRVYVEAGLAAEDRALILDPDYVDALVYKNILLRMLANQEADPGEQQRLIAEANALRERAMHLQKARRGPFDSPATAPPAPQVATSSRPGVIPPPPREATAAVDMYEGAIRLSSVRGGVKGPRKIAHVDPVYPPDAAAANARGVVIVDARIEPDGRVSQVRVLRSIPLLDEAAVDAVRQWLFEPPVLDGRAMPVIMTLTVNFMSR